MEFPIEMDIRKPFVSYRKLKLSMYSFFEYSKSKKSIYSFVGIFDMTRFHSAHSLISLKNEQPQLFLLRALPMKKKKP